MNNHDNNYSSPDIQFYKCGARYGDLGNFEHVNYETRSLETSAEIEINAGPGAQFSKVLSSIIAARNADPVFIDHALTPSRHQPKLYGLPCENRPSQQNLPPRKIVFVLFIIHYYFSH